jgi:UDP-N-acetylglucosamine--N-acetylmuramyl-(pentapeptide) pyrophosphoryl-undecaprenol N-acetylglucosamine transferase
MRILAVAGASGGHIFPAIGFLDDFKAAYPDTQTLLVLPVRSIKKNIVFSGHPVRDISVSTLSLRPSLANIKAAVNFVKGFFESVAILAQFKPDIVVGFGSIASIPVVSCAWFFRTPVMVHEQNVLPGRANRFLAHISDRIAVSFQDTAEFLSANRSKLVWTGNAVRKSLAVIDKNKALEHFGLRPDKKTILVMGGSQASRRINFSFASAFKTSLGSEDLQVIHLCGEADKADLEKEYMPYKASVRLVPFLSEMQYAYSAADLAISRAGATTIAELMAYRIPAVLIPYPYAYAHQDANAQVLVQAGCAHKVQDARLFDGLLNETLRTVMKKESLNAMRSGYDRFNGMKPVSLVDEALKICRHG